MKYCNSMVGLFWKKRHNTTNILSYCQQHTVNNVLNKSTATPMEKPALDKSAVTPRQQRKRKAPDSAKQIRDEKLKKSPVYEDELLLLSTTYCQHCAK